MSRCCSPPSRTPRRSPVIPSCGTATSPSSSTASAPTTQALCRAGPFTSPRSRSRSLGPGNHPWSLRRSGGLALAGTGDSPEGLGHHLQLPRPELVDEVCPHSAHVGRRQFLQDLTARLGQCGL